MALTKEYLEYKIFKEIADYMEFYDFLSFSVSSFVTGGTTAIANLDSHIFSSMQGTLSSINLILKDGRINDCYALLRKYHDSSIISAYESLYLEENFGIDNIIVEKINNWLHGKEKLPMFKTMISYLQGSPKLSHINALLNSDDRYLRIRDRCNNHMHYNFFYYMMINDKELHDNNRIKFLNQLSLDLKDIFIQNFVFIFSIREYYMSSSDYTDYLDAGLKPVEGSQYYVAPIVQKMFDLYIKSSRTDLATTIKNKTCMQLE